MTSSSHSPSNGSRSAAPPSSSSSSSSHVIIAAAVGVVSGSLLTVATAYYWLTTRQRRHPDTSDNSATTAITAEPTRTLPAEIRREQLSRHELYFGADNLASLARASVCIVGLGGVGSHAAMALSRGGVGFVRLVDFDQVSVSSLNRHAVATLADVGRSKVQVVADYIRRICPDPAYLQVDPVCAMLTANNVDSLLAPPPSSASWSCVIDAIDDVPSKAALIQYCLAHNLRCISCTSAGGKADPTRVHIGDLRSATRDALATKLRQYLKNMSTENENEISFLDRMQDLAVVYSSEQTVVKLADFEPEQAQDPASYGNVPGMRVRIVPVLGTMPAIFGYTMAAYALTELTSGSSTSSFDRRMQPIPAERVGRQARNKIFQQYRTRESNITKRVLAAALQEIENGQGSEESKREQQQLLQHAVETTGKVVQGTYIGPIGISQDDVEYLLEIWHNRCAITGGRLGVTLALVRWDPNQPGTCSNLVLMTTNYILQYYDNPEHGRAAIPLSVQREVERRLATCKLDCDTYMEI
jgi:tRNA threonylcarbamoyladenosine dehydratase